MSDFAFCGLMMLLSAGTGFSAGILFTVVAFALFDKAKSD